ncbi:MAG: pyridoxamine 5'-phosphate oxidase family protein [Bacteroidota bacterium]
MITEAMIPAMQGAVPGGLSTVADDGTPNVSYVSQVYYIDEQHVAISNQFLGKSIRNIQANGRATVCIVRPDNLASWYLDLRHIRTETEGELFDKMQMQLEVIASMVGMEDVFSLRAAEVFRVEAANPIRASL